MFRCGGNHSGYQSPSSWLPISRATSRSSACMKKAPQLSRSTGATGKYRFPKNLTGEIQLACWFVISCCIMFIWCYFKIIYIYYYIYMYVSQRRRLIFHSGKALPLFIGWPNTIEMKNVFPARVKIVPRVPCVTTESSMWWTCGGWEPNWQDDSTFSWTGSVLINDLPVRFSYCRSKTRGVPTSSVIIEHQPTTWFDMCGSEISTSPTIFGWWVQAQRTFALRHQFHKGLGGWIFNEFISVTTSMLQFGSVADSQVLKFLYPTQMSCIVVAEGNRSMDNV